MHIYKKSALRLAGLAMVLIPALVSGLEVGSNFREIICYVLSLLYIVIPILVGLAFLLFFWGLSKFIINSSGNEKELQTGKNYMIWGVVALFVLLSFRAIVSVVTGTLGFDSAKSFPFLPGNTTAVCGGQTYTVDSQLTNYNPL